MEFLQHLVRSLRSARTVHLPQDSSAAYYVLLPMVIANQHRSVSELLTESTFDVNKLDGRSAKTMLHIAASCGSYECVNILLRRGADVNVMDLSGSTPLQLAARNGHRKCMNKLLEFKAEVNSHNNEGLTAIHWLCVNGRTEMLTDLLQYDSVDVNVQDTQGQTALHVTCQNGHKMTANCLLDRGADIDRVNTQGATPLHSACKNGQHETADILLRRGAQFLADANGVTPIDICMRGGYSEACEVLLRHAPSLMTRAIEMSSQDTDHQHTHLKVLTYLCADNAARRQMILTSLGQQTAVTGHKLLSVSSDLKCCVSILRHCTHLLCRLFPDTSASVSHVDRTTAAIFFPLEALWTSLEEWLVVLRGEVDGRGMKDDRPRVTREVNTRPNTRDIREEEKEEEEEGKGLTGDQPAATHLTGQGGEVGGDGGGVGGDGGGVGGDGGGVDNGGGGGGSRVHNDVGGVSSNLGGVGSDVGGVSIDVGGVSSDVGGVSSDVGGVSSDVGGVGQKVGVVTETGDGMVGVVAPRICAVVEAFYMCCVAQQATGRFIDFVRRHEAALKLLVARNAKVIFNHFYFLFECPQLMSRFIHVIKQQPFEKRKAWFYERLHSASEAGTSSSERNEEKVLVVKRQNLFRTSCEQVMRTEPDRLKRHLAVVFEGEEGMGHGVVREWLDTLARELLNPDYALFTQSADGCTFQPSSQSAVNPDHLQYFLFSGRCLGLALFHRQLLNVFFTRSFYKHILGIPVDYTDVASIDPEYAQNLQWILDHDISQLGLELNFSVQTDVFGAMKVFDLKPDGSTVAVTEQNKREYVQRVAQLRMTEAIKMQIESFLTGFHQFIPQSLVQIFDEYELEMMLSGLPEIDVDDWKRNTEYSCGYCEDTPIIQWFWECVEAFDQQQRASLLQFVTGSSRVPHGGFVNLMGGGGRQKFTITSVSCDTKLLPQASTCINMLKLPEYCSKAELMSRCKVVLRCGSTGYTMI